MRHGALIDVLNREELTHHALAVMGTRDPSEFLEDLIESGVQAAESASEAGQDVEPASEAG